MRQNVSTVKSSAAPLSRTMREEIEALRKWARVRARLASSEDSEALPEADKATPRLKQEEWHNPFVPPSEGR